MARFAVKYWETYSQVFYVEAPDSETAKQIVEDNIMDDAEDYLRHIEMEESGYVDVSNICTDISNDEVWNRNVDFIGETA